MLDALPSNGLIAHSTALEAAGAVSDAGAVPAAAGCRCGENCREGFSTLDSAKTFIHRHQHCRSNHGGCLRTQGVDAKTDE